MDTYNNNFSGAYVKRVDYKDTEILKKFLNTHGRMLSKRKTNTSSRNQRKIAEAIKRARYMGLLPYISR
ncbi:MAG: 30S ribosomal protein S18 [Parcubacteria group bacterium]|nr:30S ribosomal protein S18 [Parcubacteria group bacterium]